MSPTDSIMIEREVISMPNLLQDFLSGSNTYNSIVKLKQESKNIRNVLMNSYQTTSSRVSELKRNNVLIRKTMDYFKHGDEDYGDHSAFDDDEFDDGVHSDGYQASIISADDFAELEAEKSKARYDIEKKKLDAKLITSSEIITNINIRTSEIITRLQTTNDLVNQISKRLDVLIEYNKSENDRLRQIANNSIYNNQGQLSVNSLMNYFKQNQSGVAKHTARSILQSTKLGELDRMISDKIQAFQNNILTKFLNIPAVKKFFNLNDRGNTDYSRYINNEYTKDPAIFDGMTRKTIVNIIPGYLRAITTALTGKNLAINGHGNLTTDTSNKFERVIDVTFNISNIRDVHINDITNQSKQKEPELRSADVKEVQRAIISQYVYIMYRSTDNNLKASDIANGGDPVIYDHVVKILCEEKGHNKEYWENIIDIISTKLQLNKAYREQFVTSVNSCLHKLDVAGIKQAGVMDGTERMVLTQEAFDRRLRLRLSQDSKRFEYDGKTLRQLVNEGVIDKASLSIDDLKNYDKKINGYEDFYAQLERANTESMGTSILSRSVDIQVIINDIFTRLNKGINVYNMTLDKPKEPKAQTPMPDVGVMDIPIIDIASGTMSLPASSPLINNPVKTLVNKEKAKLKTDAKMLVDSMTDGVKDMLSDKEEDSEKTNEVMASLKASEQVEGASEEDEVKLQARIEDVHDPKQKARLKKTVDGVISRGKRKKQPQSLLGKSLLFVFGLAKTFLSGAISGIKSFLTSKVNIVTNQLKESLNQIKRGKEVMMEGFKGIGERIKDRFGKSKESSDTPTMESLDESALQSRQSSTKKSSKAFDKLKESLSKTEFGQGFVDAFDKKIGSHSKIVASSLADQKSDAVNDLLKQPYATSVFASFVKALDDLASSISKWFGGVAEAEADERQKQEAAKKKKATKKTKGLGFDLGKILGGITSILAGIAKAVLTVVMSLTAVKKIMDLGMKVLKTALQPLNKAFQSLYKAIKPLMKTVANVLRQIMDYIVQIAETVIEFIKPILETIGPLLEQIMKVLEPILEMITGLVDILIVPLTAVLQTVIVPILQVIGNTLEIIMGIVQVGMGVIITGIGANLIAVGVLVKWFAHSDSTIETGKKLFDMGKNMTTSGAQNIKSGMQKSVELAGHMIGTLTTVAEAEGNPDSAEKELNKKVAQPEEYHGSPMEGIIGSGDEKAPYKFDEDVQESLSRLKSIGTGIISMFTSAGSDDLETKLEKAKGKEDFNQAVIDASGLTEEEQKKIDDRAFELFKNAQGKSQFHEESDQSYRQRYEKEKMKYWAQAAKEEVLTKVKSIADGSDAGATSVINDAMNEDGIMSSFMKSSSSAADEVKYGDFEQIMGNWFDSLDYGDDEYYDEDGYYYTGEAGDILTAAAETFVAIEKAAKDHATSSAHGAWISNVTFDDGFTIDQVSMMCTGTQAAIVKRMGYYLPSGGKPYTDTYQGDVGMISANGKNNGWGLENADGHPNIFNRDGTKSEDWVILKNPSDYQPGDISLPSQAINCHDDTLAWHAHMAAYCWNGNWYGFNGSNPLGDNQQEARSLKLAKYYLSHGCMPDEDPSMTDSEVATMSADGYNQGIVIRYVGPKGGRRRVKSSKSRLRNATGGKEDLIRSAAEIFEAYQKTNPALTYSNLVWDKPITTRSGHTRKIRPDCSGTMSAAIQELGYVLKVNGVNPGDEGIRSGTWGIQTKNTLIYDSENATTPSKDWMVLDYAQSKLEPGDITAFPPPPGQLSGHLTMPIVDLTTSPKGLDGGSGIGQSPAAAVAYLKGDKNIPWVTNGGMPAMRKIWRFLGGKGGSSSNNRRAGGKRVSTKRTAAGTRTSTLRSTGNTRKGKVSNTRTTSKGGTNAWIETAAKVFEGYYDAKNGYPTYNNSGYTTFTTRDGQSVTARTDCSGMVTASITAFGYHMKDEPWVCHNTIARSPLENNFIYDDKECTKLSKDWIVKPTSANDMQPGDITSSGGHISLPIVVSNPNSLQGLDAGGTRNLVQSGKAAKAYLNGEKDIPWYWAMGVSDGAVRTIRYVGKGGKSSGRSSGKSSSSKKSSGKRKTVTAKAAKNGKYTSAKMDPIRAGAEVFYYSWIANNKKPLLWNGTSLLNGIKFPDGFVIDKISCTFCMSMMAAIVKRMGYYLPSGGKAYTSTYQGNDFMRATIGGGSESWGMDNSDGRPNIFDKNGKKSKDWKIIYPSDGVQPGDIWFAGRGTNVHGHQPIFKGSGQWLGFNGGRNDSMANSVRLAEYYLENNEVPPASSPSIQSEGHYYDKQTGAITGAPMAFGVRFVGNAKSVKTTGTRSNVKVTSGKKKTKKKTTTKKSSSKSKKSTKSSSSKISGNTVEAQIYNYMTKNKGMSGPGAAGMMGCMKYESGLKPNNLEDSYNSQFGLTDEQYTSKVDSKQESKKNFIYGRYATCRSGQTPGEAVGYGLTQFTSSNLKKELYENSVEKGKSIADVGAQLDSVTNTLKKSKVGNVSLFQKISNSRTPTEANQWFLWRYEAGTGYNSDEAVARAYPWMGMSGINDRHTAAENYYKQLRGSGDAPDVGFVPEFYDPAPMNAFMNSLNNSNGSQFVSPMYIPPLDANPLIDYPMYDEYAQPPVIVNQYTQYTETSVLEYIDDLLVNDYNIEVPHIQELVGQIFDELPDYLEDDDDEFTYMDDLVIQQLAGLLT